MSDRTDFKPLGHLRGALRPPADKSISHRAAILAAMGEGETDIVGYLNAADTRSTLAAVQAVGARLVEDVATDALERGDGLGAARLRVAGGGLRGARPAAIDVGNAGTLLRLLPGWLAGQPQGSWTLDGDESIRRRPVDRVAVPFREMGAKPAARADPPRPPEVPPAPPGSPAPKPAPPGSPRGPPRGASPGWRSRCRPATTPSACSPPP